MAEEGRSTPANFYRFAYSVFVQTIARLESLNDLSEMDDLIMRLEYLNRSLANLDSPGTDEIMLFVYRRAPLRGEWLHTAFRYQV